MSNRTARADYLARISGEIADALRINLPCDLFDLDALFRTNKPAAYAQLASYSDAQRVALATAFAALYTARYSLSGDDALTADYILCLWRPHLEPSAPATQAAAEHIAPDTSSEPTETSMTSITFSPDATISISEPELPIITTLTLDPSLVVALRLLLETQHPSPQFHRALNGDGKRAGALRRLLDGAPFRFDPNTRLLHIASASEADRVYATDGAMCECKGASHAWCWHRCAWHILILTLALTDPHGLLAPVPLVFVAPARSAPLAA